MIVPNPWPFDQWAFHRNLDAHASAASVVDNDRRLCLVSAAAHSLRDWKTTIPAAKKAAKCLSSSEGAEDFSSPKFPTALLHLQDELDAKPSFKLLKERAYFSGAKGLVSTCCAELAYTAKDPFKRLQAAIEDPDTPSRISADLQDILEELHQLKEEMVAVAEVGTKVAAGVYNASVADVRDAVIATPLSASIAPTLKAC
jgi:hypothetical protein